MILKHWNELPDYMRVQEVKPYYDKLVRMKRQLIIKRVFDIFIALILLIILAVPMVVLGFLIWLDSKGPVIFRQERVTTYGKHFFIHKFRSMVNNAPNIGTSVTVSEDARITRIGKKMRRLRLDELPQIFDIIAGNMSFVGTRPEDVKYVKQYQPEYFATLLTPAGITSEASIRYKDEYKLLDAATDVDKVYIEQVLPAKMKWNLESISNFSFPREILTMIRTILAVFGKKYK